MAGSFLDTPIEYLKGVGPERAKLLKTEYEILTFGDLLRWYPYRYVDRTKFYKTTEITGDLPYVQLRGKILRMQEVGANKGKRITAQLIDAAGSVELVWFAGLKWLQGKYNPQSEYIVFGKPNVFNGKINIAHPETEEVTEENLKRASALQPMYSTSEISKFKGIDSKGMMKLQKTLSLLIGQPIQGGKAEILESLPLNIIENLKLLSKEDSLKQIHFPSDPTLLHRAEARIKFEEFLYIQLRLLRVKKNATGKFQRMEF